MPCATDSGPTISLSQPSSPRCSAVERSVESMRSSCPGRSLGWDRASSYVGPSSLKRAPVSHCLHPGGEPPDGGRVAPPCVYLRGFEYVGGVKHEAGGEGHPNERGHIPSPPRVGL